MGYWRDYLDVMSNANETKPSLRPSAQVKRIQNLGPRPSESAMAPKVASISQFICMPFVSLNGRLCSLWVTSRGAPCLLLFSFLLHFSFMSQATGYSASNGIPFVVPVRFATPVVFPLLQPPPSFKHGDHQEPLARNAQAKSLHPSMSGEPETHSSHTATATSSMPHPHLVVDPPPSGRELRPRSKPNPTCSGDVQPASQPPAKKSHARKQPEGHIPRPRNAFILFRCDFVAQKKIPASVEPDHRNISRIVGRVWKAMSAEERRPWVEEAKKERETHKRLYPQYRYSPSSTATGATGTTGTNLRTKRAQNKKMRESMGVLPAWEIARPRSITQTRSLRCDRSTEPTEEPQRREDPREEAMLQPRTQRIISDSPRSSVPDRGEAVSQPLFRDQSLSSVDWGLPSHQSWEFPSEEPQHRSPRDGVADTMGSFPGLNSPRTFETPTPPFHFDSPDHLQWCQHRCCRRSCSLRVIIDQ
ncbi:hypothetical protein EI94DRAFT_1681655 [Lactarius quietus]|nr:hypothetical protein EI94DRAFT_1681655 [Lactarius quietus]